MSAMRAKFRITKIEKPYEGCEKLTMMAVTDKPFDEHGASEDNSFARWTPEGELTISIQNPALLQQFKEGDPYYLDFTKAEK